MGAAVDCETIGSGLLGQPVNSLTTAAFVVAGVLVLSRRPERRWVGVGLVSTGVGSFLFHGPMPSGSEWAHDLTLAWLLVLVAASVVGESKWSRAPGFVALGVVFAVFPVTADPVAVGLTAVAIFLLLSRDRSPATLGPVGLLAAAAVVGRLGATGGPLCDPDSLLQPHGLWHVASATAVAWWAMGAPRRETPQPV